MVAFSRENLDTEARWEMELAAGLFTRVSQDFDRLISINDAGASAESSRAVSAIRFRLMVTLLGASLLAMVGIVALGIWTALRVARARMKPRAAPRFSRTETASSTPSPGGSPTTFAIR